MEMDRNFELCRRYTEQVLGREFVRVNEGVRQPAATAARHFEICMVLYTTEPKQYTALAQVFYSYVVENVFSKYITKVMER